ncbi:MAG: hypothetical protein ACOVP8_08560, partial [Phycisphaerales bacterium]
MARANAELVVKHLTLAMLAGMMMLAAHATVNEWEWRRFEDVTRVIAHGSQSQRDLSASMQERYATWDASDRAPLHQLEALTSRMDRQRWQSDFLGIPRIWDYTPAAVSLLVASLLNSIALLVSSGVCGWLSTTRGGLGISHGSSDRAAVRRFFLEIDKGFAVRSVTCAAVAGLLGWYVTYDRSQSERLVSESVIPTTSAYAVMTSLLVISLSLFRWTRSNRTLVRDERVKRDRMESGINLCACPRCGYELGMLHAERCPECGRLVSTHENKRPNWFRRTLVVCAVLITCIAIWASEGLDHALAQRRLPQPLLGSLAWLSVRGELLPPPGGLLQCGSIAIFDSDGHRDRLIIIRATCTRAPTDPPRLAIAWTEGKTARVAWRDDLVREKPVQLALGGRIVTSRFSVGMSDLIAFTIDRPPDRYSVEPLTQGDALSGTLDSFLAPQGYIMSLSAPREVARRRPADIRGWAHAAVLLSAGAGGADW